MSDIVELLERLARNRVDLILVDGRLEADAPAGVLQGQLLEDLRSHRVELRWALHAYPNHQWRRCDACGRCQLVAKERKRHRCIMSPDCDGSLPAPSSPWRPTAVAWS